MYERRAFEEWYLYYLFEDSAAFSKVNAENLRGEKKKKLLVTFARVLVFFSFAFHKVKRNKRVINVAIA